MLCIVQIHFYLSSDLVHYEKIDIIFAIFLLSLSVYVICVCYLSLKGSICFKIYKWYL